MKRKCSHLAEVQLDAAAADSLSLTNSHATAVFTVRQPSGAYVSVPAGFDADELMTLLVVVQESLK